MQPQPSQQVSPMQRPPTIVNTSVMPQPNASVGVPSMRPMVAGSPMQASMMMRPVGSPYGAVNRPIMYDKNKRPIYPTDPRPQGMMQPGQQPPMNYAPVGPGSNQMIMQNAMPPGAGPMRQ